MKNPFKVGEKVLTKVKRKEVEALITKLWQNEVQVRTPDNELRWRSMYTVWYPGFAPLARDEEGGNAAITPSMLRALKRGAKQQRAKAKKLVRKQPNKRR